MTARTHDAFAFASLITVAALFPPERLNTPTVFVALVASIIGALLPDMDQASNRLWDLFPAGDTFGKFLRRAFWSHRTLSHSLIGSYIFYRFFSWSLPLVFNDNYVYPEVILASLMIGIFSHLLADGLTTDGVPLFFPFRLSVGFPPLSFLRIRTGGFVENFLVLPAIAAYLFWFLGSYQSSFTHLANLL
jgi:inner membrane protein